MRIELRTMMRRVLSVVALTGLVVSTTMAAPTGGFLAVLNEQRNNGDSMNTIEFLDADDPSVPLFSVYIGSEFGVSNTWEDPQSITVDPNTGDVYFLAFDSGSGATIGVPDSLGDTQGDLDLFKIPFATVYDHWAANFEGHNVQGEALAAGPGPSGIKNSLNLDYVTYGSITSEFSNFHSNRVTLPGVVSKIGEIARGDGGSFFGTPLEFVDSETLFFLDDSVTAQATDNALDDHSLSVIKKVPGPATITMVMPGGGASNYRDGGWNGNTTEAWESTRLTTLNMDGTGHSEPRTMTYYDNGAGIRGFWIVDGDFTTTGTPASDAIGFLQIDTDNTPIGWRPIVGEGSFMGVSDDPAADPDATNGKIHEIFVDASGGLVLVETGFLDGPTGDAIHPADQEPGVLRVSVNYDNGSGEIELGAWEPKQFVLFNNRGDYNDDGFVDAADYTVWRDNLGAAIALPNEDPSVTAGSVTAEDYDVWKAQFGATGEKGVDGDGTEFSQHATFDAANNLLYFFSPDSGGSFNTDLHVLDLTSGVTTSYLDWDDSVSLFGDVDGDSVAYFNLATPAGLGGVAGVPEPASAVMLIIGLACACLGRRRASR